MNNKQIEQTVDNLVRFDKEDRLFALDLLRSKVDNITYRLIVEILTAKLNKN